MKDLNLEQLGVQELNAVEVKETDGGVILIAAWVTLTTLAWAALIASGAEAGWNAYKQ